MPLLVHDALGDRRTLIGLVMALDNVLLLLLVPLAGAASDRAVAGGASRLPIVIGGLVLSALGMALFPGSAALGLGGIVAAMVLLYTGINVQRSPFQALMADLVPSPARSLAAASVTFQMCVGAIVFLMLGRTLGMSRAFLVAAATVVLIAVAFALGLRRAAGVPSRHRAGETASADPDAPFDEVAADAAGTSFAAALREGLRGRIPGLRAIFVAALLLQLTFQTFTTWFALHGTARFGVRPEDVTLGFIAWALGGVAGALPAGVIGVRFGRRMAMLIGFALMAACLIALDRVESLTQAVPLLALASASWTLPTVNAYPLFVEPIPSAQRGVLAALFLLCMALGGAVGDPLNGLLFDLAASYRPLFLVMTAYTALAFAAIWWIPRGVGEAGTGPALSR